jgi:replicative DNA helicase
LNITAILLKKVISEADSETWSQIRRHYLPVEYQSVYKVINKHFESFNTLPSFDALKLSVRNDLILNKIYAIQLADVVDIDNEELLSYLKNQYTQEEIMAQIDKYLDNSIMMETAKESLDSLYKIIINVEDKVDLKDPKEDMARIELFESEEEIANAFSIGLNSDHDAKVSFTNQDYILIGGKRGAGKSLACANIAVNKYNQGKSSIYFTIEMTSRSTLQRMSSIATGVPFGRLKKRNLSHTEWNTVARWWSERFNGGEDAYIKYLKHQDFDQLHIDLTKHSLLPEKQLDIVYEPNMSLATIRSELDKKVEIIKPAVILVDYVNQLKRSTGSYNGQYDWTEQIEISKALKNIAQEYEIPVVSPYQMDATGEARFAKGLLDSADAAYTLNPHNKEDGCMTFDCVKIRDNQGLSFTSKVIWETLRIGPQSAANPLEKIKATGEESQDL